MRFSRLVGSIAGVASVVTVAHADMVGPSPSYVAPALEFWEQAIEPHAAEVRIVLDKINLIVQQLPYLYDSDPAGQTRQQTIDDGIGMLRYARRLTPLNADVLRNLGSLADEGGHAELALEAYAAYLAETHDDSDVPAEVYMRLGRIRARLRDYEHAVHDLRKALVANVTTGGYSPFQYSPGHTMVALSSSLAASGRLADAVDTLRTYLTRIPYYGDESAIQTGFALAVSYDRDEQRSNAFEMLDLLISANQGNYGVAAYNALSRLSFTPAIDQHYYFALLYESLDYLAEARTEWSAYARGGGEALFADRALDHVTAIDQMLSARLVKERAAKSAAKRKQLAPRVSVP